MNDDLLKEADGLLSKNDDDLLNEADSLMTNPQSPKEPISRKESFMKGAEQGATLGFADEGKGVMSGLMDDAMRIANLLGLSDTKSPRQMDEDLAAQGFKIQGYNPNKTVYEEARNVARGEYKDAENAYQSKIPFTDISVNPYNFAGNLAGGMVTMPFMPAKMVAPMGAVGEMAPLLTTQFAKQAAKSAINSIPTSAVASMGISEGETPVDVLKDTAVGTGMGMVLSPTLEKGLPAVANVASKTGDKFVDLLNMFPGEPANRFKLGMRGILGVSKSTGEKIQGILDKQISKFRNKVDEADLARINQENVTLQNIEASISANENKVKELSNEYNDLLAQQSAYKRDALYTKKDEKSTLFEQAKTKLKEQIDALESEKDQLLANYEKETFDSIKKYENDLSKVKSQEEILKGEKTKLKDFEPKRIGDKAQQAFEADKAQIKANYDMLDEDLATRNVKFNVSQDLKDFETTISGLARGDKELTALNKNILSTLKKYKGQIDRKTLIDLVNGFKDKYGKQQGSALKMIRSKIKDPTINRLYGTAFDGLEDSVRKTQDFQLREFGHEDLANQYAQNNKAYRAIKDLENTYGGDEYSANIVSQIQDLGKFGNASVNKGAKGIVSDIEKNTQNLPSFTRILPEEISPYIKKSTEELPSQMVQNANQMTNIENILSNLKVNQKKPNQFSQNPKDVELLNKITELENLVGSNKKNLQTEQFGEDFTKNVNALDRQIDDLNTGIDPTYNKFTEQAKQNQNARNMLLQQNENSTLSKRELLAPKPKTTQLDKMLAKDPIDRDAELRKMILAADKERTLGGLGSASEKLDNLATELDIPISEMTPEIKELQDLLSAYKDNINFAFNKAGGVATGGETLGAIANAAGYVAGIPNRMVNKALTPVMNATNKGLNYVGKQNIIPTKMGLQSIDDVLAKISNKPLQDVMKMDSTGKAALKNTLLQISPEVRKYLEDKENKK